MAYALNPKQFKYYNAPDGEKPIEKVIATSKYGFFLGTVAGTAECVMSSAPKTPLLIFNCVANYAVPLTAICATFSAVTYASTKIRGVDGPMNHAIGAIAAVGVLYKWKKNPVGAANYAILGAIGAAAMKHARQIGLELFPTFPTRTSNYGLYAGHDSTWAKDPRPWKN